MEQKVYFVEFVKGCMIAIVASLVTIVNCYVWWKAPQTFGNSTMYTIKDPNGNNEVNYSVDYNSEGIPVQWAGIMHFGYAKESYDAVVLVTLSETENAYIERIIVSLSGQTNNYGVRYIMHRSDNTPYEQQIYISDGTPRSRRKIELGNSEESGGIRGIQGQTTD